MTIKPSRFALIAWLLVRNGWRPLPGCAGTKHPSFIGWPLYNLQQWEKGPLNEMIRGRGQTHGDIVCLAIQKEIVAVDLDIEDLKLAEYASMCAIEHLGVTPLVRIGREPRRVLIFRSDGAIRSRKCHPIEIFSGSGQVVGFGYHPGAGRDYLWPDKSPLDLSSDDSSIPLITQAMVDRFLQACWVRIPRKFEERTRDAPAFVGLDHVADREQALKLIQIEAEKLSKAELGTRNTTLFRASYVAGQAIGAGLVQRQEAESIISSAAWDCGLNDDGDGACEVRTTMKSGIERGVDNPFFVVAMWFESIEAEPGWRDHQDAEAIVDAVTGLDGITFHSHESFRHPPSLVKGLLSRNGIAFLGGQSGAGKTFMAVDLAVALATGQPFFGRRIKEKVGVLFVAGEGAATLQLRITVACRARNVVGLLPIALTSTFPDFTKAQEVGPFLAKLRALDEFMQQAHGVRLGVIIIDTLTAVFNMQDENDNSEAATIIRALKALGDRMDALIIPVHHYGKTADTGLRGASAFRAGADEVLSPLLKTEWVRALPR